MCRYDNGDVIGSNIIKIELSNYRLVVTGSPLERGEGGVSYLHIYNLSYHNHLAITGLFAVCFS